MVLILKTLNRTFYSKDSRGWCLLYAMHPCKQSFAVHLIYNKDFFRPINSFSPLWPSTSSPCYSPVQTSSLQFIQELGRAPERSLSQGSTKLWGLNHYHCHNFLGFLKTQFNNSRIMKMIEKPHNWVALLHQLQPRQRVHPPKNKISRILYDRCQIWQLVDNENIIDGVGGQNW